MRRAPAAILNLAKLKKRPSCHLPGSWNLQLPSSKSLHCLKLCVAKKLCRGGEGRRRSAQTTNKPPLGDPLSPNLPSAIGPIHPIDNPCELENNKTSKKPKNTRGEIEAFSRTKITVKVPNFCGLPGGRGGIGIAGFPKNGLCTGTPLKIGWEGVWPTPPILN